MTHYSSRPFFLRIQMAKKKIYDSKEKINQQYVDYYNKILETLSFILDEYTKEMIRSDISFLDMPRNSLATLDFLVGAVTKIQKGHRLSLGLNENEYEDISPQINIIEGLKEEKI